MRYYDVARKLSGTIISDLPGVNVAHSLIVDIIEYKYQLLKSKRWIKYDGKSIYIDTSDYVGKQLATCGVYEPEVHQAINTHLNKGDLAIDVGAHIGHHTVTMRDCVGTDGKVYAFEPNPENAEIIDKTLQENEWDNVELFPIALSDTESSDQLVVYNSDNTGSASLPNSNTDTGADADHKYTVEIKKLSSIFKRMEKTDIGLLKIDVEGEETNIIRDLSGLLCHIETILVEFHTQKADTEDIIESFEILSSKGKITGLNGSSVELDNILRQKKTIIWQPN